MHKQLAKALDEVALIEQGEPEKKLARELSKTHHYHKGEVLYGMVMEKVENSESYLLLDDGIVVKPKYSKSPITPTKLTFFVVENDKRVDITEKIEETLKSEIIEDWIRIHQ